MDTIISFFNQIGSLICHQLPSRTIYLEGLPLPVCARDTGIYLGIFTGTVFIMFMKRFDSDKPPGVFISVLLCILMLPMVIDGIGSYTGLIETNNNIRLVTGAFFGLPIPFFLLPAAHFKIAAANKRSSLKSPVELITVIAATALMCGLVLKSRMLPYLLVSTIIVMSFIFLTGRISFTIIVRLSPATYRYRYLTTAGITLCVLSVLYVISAYILQPLKELLLRQG